MVLVDGQGTPVGLHLDSASPSEMKLLEPTLKTVRSGAPERLIGDRGYDSNAVRAFLHKQHIDPIIPKRSNNTRATDQDGRKLRRYKRRWIIERTNAWLQNFRRVLVRHERSIDVYQTFVHMACAMIALRRLVSK